MSNYLMLILLMVWPVVNQTEFVSKSDPDRLARITHVMYPVPPVLLSRNDAVAYELLTHSRTLEEEQVLLTASMICRLSKKLGYDPLLFIALIRTESNFNHLAISPVGAEGLMQVMPPTARWMANKLDIEWPSKHSFDPVLNVELGIHYLDLMAKEFNGNISHALTAYNRGPRATRYILDHNNNRLPSEIDEFYSAKVMKHYNIFVAKYEELDLE